MLGEPGATKTTPLLGTPATLTTTGPVVAPAGTVTVTVPVPQPVTVAGTPLKVTVLVPCEAPKPAPPMVTEVPTGPSGGIKLNIWGTFSTLKVTVLLGTPATEMTIFPDVAPVGTVPVIDVPDQLVIVSAEPFSVIVLVPCVFPKLSPETSKVEPTSPLVGVMPEINGVGSTVNCARLLAAPLTVTITLPVVVSVGTTAVIAVGVQLLAEATIPSTVTVLAPSMVPKPSPLITTLEPAGPELGDRLRMLGFGATTDAVVDPQMAPVQAVTLADPTAKPAATPWLPESLDTVRADKLEELQVADASACVPFPLKVPVAEKASAVPLGNEGLAGVTAIDTRFVGTMPAG